MDQSKQQAGDQGCIIPLPVTQIPIPSLNVGQGSCIAGAWSANVCARVFVWRVVLRVVWYGVRVLCNVTVCDSSTLVSGAM